MKPELLAPAGSREKLEAVYRFGADAAYIGVGSFSLRSKAETADHTDPDRLRAIKGEKRLYGALNIYFHDEDLDRLESEAESIARLPLDGLILSDPGVMSRIRALIPDIDLHLSTQANCINSESAKLYRDLGFKRLILGRELTIGQIAKIRAAVPDVELECFVHGAMCIAYSGRCYLSRYMAGRSANKGECAHSCRWEYRFVEEAKRPGEYYPVYGDESYTTIFSSKDLCMFDAVPDLLDAGIDSLKIEGRMKSQYYAAMVTQAYRGAIDAACGERAIDLDRLRAELFNVSHREYSTGFYYGDPKAVEPTASEYFRERTFLGIVGRRIAGDAVGNNTFELDVKNQIRIGTALEFVGPGGALHPDVEFSLSDDAGQTLEKADHGRPTRITTRQPVEPGFLVRSADDAYAGSSERTRSLSHRSLTARS